MVQKIVKNEPANLEYRIILLKKMIDDNKPADSTAKDDTIDEDVQKANEVIDLQNEFLKLQAFFRLQ